MMCRSCSCKVFCVDVSGGEGGADTRQMDRQGTLGGGGGCMWLCECVSSVDRVLLSMKLVPPFLPGAVYFLACSSSILCFFFLLLSFSYVFSLLLPLNQPLLPFMFHDYSFFLLTHHYRHPHPSLITVCLCSFLAPHAMLCFAILCLGFLLRGLAIRCAVLCTIIFLFFFIHLPITRFFIALPFCLFV